MDNAPTGAPVQTDLWSFTPAEQVLAPTPGRVRRGGPTTSLKAAERVSLRSGSQKARLLVVLAERGPQIPHDLAPLAGCAYPHVATTRLHDLRDLGLVEMTSDRRATPSGGESHVWRVTPEGAHVASQLRQEAA